MAFDNLVGRHRSAELPPLSAFSMGNLLQSGKGEQHEFLPEKKLDDGIASKVKEGGKGEPEKKRKREAFH